MKLRGQLTRSLAARKNKSGEVSKLKRELAKKNRVIAKIKIARMVKRERAKKQGLARKMLTLVAEVAADTIESRL